uniref:Ribonuclease H-like domain-containing protein n=1 Tax=Tanacetum cinerariifolium TaxID=118510 RepID=A0A6L2N9X5_TANCI|nr:ribonuclease H-like domain-containing protein [Tanacetum cinerariifolium]
MLTQQDIYAAGSENRPPMLNIDNYVPWTFRLLHYAKSKPNGNLIYNSIMNGPYIKRRILEPVPVANAPRAVDLADSHVSTSINQDDPSTSIPSTQEQEHYPIISQGFEESPKTPYFHDDPLHESLHEDLISQGSSSNVRPIHTPFESLGR